MGEESEPSVVPSPPETPEWLKSIFWLWHNTRANWDLLMKGPVLAALLIVLAGGFFLGELSRSDQHEIDQERLSFLQDQINAYRDRLQGATPDEAAKRFSTLENALANANVKINRFFPDKKRRLSDEDKDFVKLHTAEIKSVIIRYSRWNSEIH